MKKMKFIAVFLIMIMVICSLGACGAPKNISPNINKNNMFTSPGANNALLTIDGKFVKWTQNAQQFQVKSNNRTYTFIKPQGFDIIKETLKGKKVIVTYYVDASGNKVATNIVVK